MSANAASPRAVSTRKRGTGLLLALALGSAGCGHFGLDGDAPRMSAFTLTEVARAAASALRGQGDPERPAVVPGEFVGNFLCGLNDEPAAVLAQTSADGALRVTWISSASTDVCRAEFTFRVRDERVHLQGSPLDGCPEVGDRLPKEAITDDFAIRHSDWDRLVFGAPGFELVCRRGPT
jgi:hypothetical protein